VAGVTLCRSSVAFNGTFMVFGTAAFGGRLGGGPVISVASTTVMDELIPYSSSIKPARQCINASRHARRLRRACAPRNAQMHTQAQFITSHQQGKSGRRGGKKGMGRKWRTLVRHLRKQRRHEVEVTVEKDERIDLRRHLPHPATRI